MEGRKKESLYIAAVFLQKFLTAVADVLWLVLLAELIGEVTPGNGGAGNMGKMAQYILGLILLSVWKRMGYSLGRNLTLKLQDIVRFRLNCLMVEKTAKIPYRLLEDQAFCELRQTLQEHIHGNARRNFVWDMVQKSGNLMLYCVRILGISLLLAWTSIPLGILFVLLEICHCLITALGMEQEFSFVKKRSPQQQYMEELALGQEGAGERSLFAYAGHIAEKCDREAAGVRKASAVLSLEYQKAELVNRVLAAITFVLTEIALIALVSIGRISLGYFIALSIGINELIERDEGEDAFRHLRREKLFVKQWKRFMDFPEMEGIDEEKENRQNGEWKERADRKRRNGEREERADRKRRNREWKESADRKRQNGEWKERADRKRQNGEWKERVGRKRRNGQEWKRSGEKKTAGRKCSVREPFGNEYVIGEEYETLEFRNVSFRYPRTGRTVLHDLNFKLERGGYYAFVGVNGSGKTTIVKLLSGMYDTYQGEILLNGVELRAIPLQERRRIFAILFQDAARYEDTVLRNIAPGDDFERRKEPGGKNLDGKEPNRKNHGGKESGGKSSAARRLAEELVREWSDGGSGRFPQGVDTFLGSMEEDGVMLSRGEWQQLLIARELAQPAQVRIMDEPMASLDIFRQGRFYEQFTEDMESHTTILFSHHMTAVRMAKRIFVLKDGAIVEEGSHRQLMAQKGIYAGMYEIQCEDTGIVRTETEFFG